MSIYLIQCQSYRQLNEKIKELTDKNTTISYVDFFVTDLADIIEEASSFSLFGEKKVIVVKNAEIFCTGKNKEENNELLISYMDTPNINTTLIFTTINKLDMRKTLTKKIKEKYQTIVVEAYKPYEVAKKVEEYFKKQKYTFSKDIITYITSSCLNNYDLVCSELEKIDLYYQDEKEIKIIDIENIISKVNEDNNFKFVDLIVSKNMPKALSTLSDLKLSKVEPTVLLSLVVREYRLMYYTKILADQGLNCYNIAKELGLQDWQVEKVLKTGYAYKKDEIEDIMLKAYETDIALKSNYISRYLPLELFILDI